MRIAIAAARFNEAVTDPMVETAEQRIAELGHDHPVTLRVPGVYDLPLAVQRLLDRADVDGVVAIGAVVTGETDHDQVLMHSTSKTLQELSLDFDKPVSLAITGPGMSQAQAEARIDYAAQGIDACLATYAELEDVEIDAALEAGGH